MPLEVSTNILADSGPIVDPSCRSGTRGGGA